MAAHHKLSRQCLGVHRGHEGTVYSIDVHGTSPPPQQIKKQKEAKVTPQVGGEDSEGKITLLSASHDQTIVVWDVTVDMSRPDVTTAKMRQTRTLKGHTSTVYALELIPRPNTRQLHLLSGGDQTVRYWDLDTGESLRAFAGHSNYVSCLRVRGKRAFSGSWDTTLRSWNLESGKPMHIFKGHRNIVNCIDVTDTDVYSGSWDMTIIQWSRATGEPVNVYRGHTDGVQCLQVHDELLLSGSMDKTIRIWSQKTAKTIRILTGHDGGVECLHVAEHMCFSGSYDKTIRCFRIDSGECIAVFAGHTDGVYCVKYFAGILYSGSGDKTIRLWDAKGLTRAIKRPWWKKIFCCG